MNATEYCDTVMHIANTPGYSLFVQVDTEEAKESEPQSPISGGQAVHAPEAVAPSAPTDKLYTKSESLQYSESIVFDKLKTIYEALAGAASDFEYEDIGNDTGNVFGYVFFSRYNTSVTDISQLLYSIELVTTEQTNGSSNSSSASSSASGIDSSSDTQASSNPSTRMYTGGGDKAGLVSLQGHIQHAVALQHFMQTTIMQPTRYVKNACIQLVNTYVESIIHGVFYTKLDNSNRALIASLLYTGPSTLQYTITGNRCLTDIDGEG
jgi:hypothetical protein